MGATRTPAGSPGLLRSSTAATLCGLVTAALAATAAAHLRALDAGATVDALVLVAVVGAGSLAGAALTAGCSLLAVSALCRRAGRTSRALEDAAARLTPAVLRRAVAITVGAGMGLAPTAAGATATPAPEPSRPVTVTPDLGWVVTTTPAPGGPPVTTGPPPSSPPPVSTTPGGASAAAVAKTHLARLSGVGDAQVTVRVGDSLWSIAAAQLPDGACDADVAAAWPVLYERNRLTIGPDPDHIHPGQVLVVPPLPVTTADHAQLPTDPSEDDR